MPDISAIIIGAGVAGLATGCYAQMNGYDTQILEQHTIPGGVCTAWKRYGRNASAYTFDGCIHWLVGSKQGSPMNAIWQELGAAQGRQMVDHDEFMRYKGPGGKDFVLYTNVDQLEQHMKQLAPADTRVSTAFCNAIRRMIVLGQMGEASGLLGRIKTTLKMIPFMLTSRRLNAELAQNPFDLQTGVDLSAIPGIEQQFLLALVGLTLAASFLYAALSAGTPRGWRPQENGAPRCRRCGAEILFRVAHCPACEQRLTWWRAGR